ncbi:MAG TPA: tetratricopeptide repeat protein [Terriglobales bacterium]|nr:tetratricopeptide repeat protein [Terriglobales bacterium]
MSPIRGFMLIAAAVLCLSLSGVASAQENQDNQPHIQPRVDPNTPAKKQPKSQSTQSEKSSEQTQPQPAAPQTSAAGSNDQREQGESSSLDSQIDLNARPHDAGGTRLPEDAESFPYDPHRAEKDLEVGNYYLKLKNYRAALERFRDALLYKPGDAEATYGLAVTQEKIELFSQAYKSYNRYLEILPNGPRARDAKLAVERLEPRVEKTNVSQSDHEFQSAQALRQGETFLAQNDFDAARIRFEDAMRLAPDSPEVYFRLAQSLQGLERLDPARQFYKKYLEMQPAGPFAADAKRSIEQITAVLGK